MSTIDQQFIEYIVKSIVGSPDAVKVERRVDEKGVLLELTVDGEDLGRVIGKRGATAQSLRTLLRALGTKNDARYNLKIIDDGHPAPPRRDDDDRPAVADDSVASTDDVQADDQQDDQVADEAPDESPDEAPEEEVVADEPAEAEEAPEPEESDTLARTRKELDDLDDLDI